MGPEPFLHRWLRHLGSWRLRLLALVVLAAAPPVLLTLWEQQRTARDRLAGAGHAIEDLAVNAAREQAALIGQVRGFLAAAALLPALGDGTTAQCRQALDYLSGGDLSGGAPWLRSLAVHAADGQPVCAGQPGAAGAGDGARVRAAIASGGFVLSGLVTGRGAPLVIGVQPIPHAGGAARRVLVAGIDLARLGDAGLPRVPAGAEVMLVADADGLVVARYPAAPALIGRSLHGTGLAVALRGQPGHAEGHGLTGAERQFGFAPIPGTGATVVVGRDPARVLAPVLALQRQVLLLAAGAALLALLLALAAGRWLLLRPMARFGHAVRRIAGGDLGARVRVGRLGGELGALAGEINRMAARLAEHQAALEDKNAELARLAGELAVARDTAEAASAAKTRFVGMLSHELRTPLNGILGHAELLGADRSLTPAQRRSADQITASGEHLMAMIRELLDLASIEAGKVTLAPAPVRLAALAEACAALIQPAATAKGLAFGVELAPPSAGWVAADALRLRQVLLNLLANAVKFTPRGEVVLRIGPAAGGFTRFEVADTGPGMTRAECASLFQEFLRLPGTAEAEGNGLGLAISARLVALMGGTIGCDSVPGRGSRFWVELPLPPALAPGAAPGTAAALGASLRLLLADDVLVNREVARALLGGAGHRVEVVADGALAVAAALAEDWDAVLLDVHMPVMDGLTAARRIRAAPGQRGRVPILAVTANANTAEVAACLAAGMDAHVEKPLRTAELQSAVAGIRARALRPLAAE